MGLKDWVSRGQRDLGNAPSETRTSMTRSAVGQGRDRMNSFVNHPSRKSMAESVSAIPETGVRTHDAVQSP